MKLHDRMIRAGFWSDTLLIRSLDRDGRNLFIGLTQLADDAGCVADEPEEWRMLLYPGDLDVTADRLAEYRDVLLAKGRLIRYASGGNQYLFIQHFHRHQTLQNARPPECPSPPWVTWTPSDNKYRHGSYAINEPSGQGEISDRNLPDTYQPTNSTGKEEKRKEEKAPLPPRGSPASLGGPPMRDGLLSWESVANALRKAFPAESQYTTIQVANQLRKHYAADEDRRTGSQLNRCSTRSTSSPNAASRSASRGR